MKHALPLLAGLTAALIPASCDVPSEASPDGFAGDAAFLEEHVEILRFASGTGAFLVAPGLQGRVMTAAVTPDGGSLGFVNRDAITARGEPAAFHNHGGAERFWIGPESGPYAFFFDAGEPHERDRWRVPGELDTGGFAVAARDEDAVELRREVALQNVAGTRFSLDVTRRIEVPAREDVVTRTGPLPDGAAWTAFRSSTEVTNAGEQAWTREGGLPCIWILGMFTPGPRAFVVVPFRPDHEDPDGGPPVRADYFGEVPPSRFRIGEEAAVFRADAREEGKIGVLRNRARDVIGAWDPGSRVLTLVYYGPVEPDMPYMNEHWGLDLENPYYGDVANSYNAADGTFYELESSSPALALAPGESWTHRSMTVHVRIEDDAALAAFASRALGVDWNALPQLP